MPETGSNAKISIQVGLNGYLSLFTYKCTLVPKPFFNEAAALSLLSDVVSLDPGDTVSFVDVPQYVAVLLYADVKGSSALPEMYYLLVSAAGRIGEYNKIAASYCDGRLYLVVAQGKSLMLCNSFAAADFATAEYFIFMVLKKLQLNPEVSTIYFRTKLTEEDEMSLYRYFRAVEQI